MIKLNRYKTAEMLNSMKKIPSGLKKLMIKNMNVKKGEKIFITILMKYIGKARI